MEADSSNAGAIGREAQRAWREARRRGLAWRSRTRAREPRSSLESLLSCEVRADRITSA